MYKIEDIECFVYKSKQYLFTRTLPRDYCSTSEAALATPNFRDLRKWKHT